MEQALVAYTVNNAYAGFQEHQVGRIGPGHLGDLTVLDRDLIVAPAESIREANALRTIVGGQERFIA